jgi:hypothetical protein
MDASVTASAPSTATTSTTTQGTQTQGTPQGQGGAKHSPSQGKVSAETATKADASTQGEDDEFEEFKIGGESAKVPKKIAAKLKEIERGAQEKFRQTAKERQALQAEKQQLDQINKLAKEDPKAFRKFLADKGVDPYEFAEMTLAEKLEEISLSPEQKRIRELEEKTKQYEDAERTKKEEAEKAEYQKKFAVVQQDLDREISEAWKESGLPQDVFYVKHMAAVMKDGYAMAKSGDLPRPLTAKEAASIVKERFEASLPRIFKQMPEEGILKLIGEENFTRLRDWDVTRTIKPVNQPGNPRPGQKPASTESVNSKKPMNELEYREYMAKLADG